MASRAERALGHLRLIHPFPSALDGLVAAGAAWLAGGAGEAALRLGVSMVCLQASVGALNDLVDAPHDAGHKPGKPIPAGLVAPATARAIAVAAGVLGVALALPSGVPTAGLAAVLLSLGYAYDLRFKGTAWSWLPFALAIPLFPTYGWLGAVGTLPAVWAILLPTAVLAGTALALGNAAVDVERDRAAGIRSIATHLGHHRAARASLALLAAVSLLALATIAAAGAVLPWVLVALAGTGLALAGAGMVHADAPERRERGWEIEAVGVALLSAGWLAAMAAAGLTD